MNYGGHSGGGALTRRVTQTPPLRNGSKDVEHIVKAAIHHRDHKQKQNSDHPRKSRYRPFTSRLTLLQPPRPACPIAPANCRVTLRERNAERESVGGREQQS